MPDNQFFMGDFGGAITFFLGTVEDGGPDLTGSNLLLFAEFHKPHPFLDSALMQGAGSFTDQTLYMKGDFRNSIHLLPDKSVAVNDAFYVGDKTRFGSLEFTIGKVGVGNWAVVWEYLSSGGWVALPVVVDDTDSFRKVGTNHVSWTWVEDWVPTVVNNKGPYFFVRARVVTPDPAIIAQAYADSIFKGPASIQMDIVDPAAGAVSVTIPKNMLDENGVYRIQSSIQEGNHALTHGSTVEIEVLLEGQH